MGEPDASKLELQRVMSTFLRNSWKGSLCIYIDERTGQRHNTRYFLDKEVTYLIVADAGNSSAPHVRCPISIVRDIYTIDDGHEVFPEKVLGLCTHTELPLLLMVSLNVKQSRNGTCSICIIAESVAERDMFFDCMSLLTGYAQSNSRTS